MALKGHTVIELTDVVTGEVETLSDDNMVTNAISEVLSTNIEAMLYTMNSYTSDWKTNMFPLCPNAIGGILLFAEPLEENANNYYAPSSNPCVGYASNDVNSTADVMRGSLNLTESGQISNGYKFVWDFATSQANGTIAAVALTHKFGGVGYFGDEYNASNKLWSLKNASTEAGYLIRTLYVYAVEVNFEENYFWCIGLNASSELVIRKVRKCFTKVGLNFTLLEDGDEVIEEVKLTPTSFILPNASYNYAPYTMHDGKDGYWYGFMNSSNSSGTATIKWIKIKKSDFSFTEGTWTFENVKFYQGGYSYYFDTSGPYIYRYSVVHNGYLYLMHYSKTGLYKINLNNSADITYIPFGFTSDFSYNSNKYQNGYIYMWVLGDWVCGSDFRVSSNDEVVKTASSTPFYCTTTPVFQYGPFLLTFGSYDSDTAKKGLWLLTPYLATINNLSTAVIKTADKTMKITYTLTETE